MNTVLPRTPEDLTFRMMDDDGTVQEFGFGPRMSNMLDAICRAHGMNPGSAADRWEALRLVGDELAALEM